MRRRFYGKPLPAKRQVKAHLQLLSMISDEPSREKMKMDRIITLTKVEIDFLVVLIGSEYKAKNDRQLHAASHGSDFYDPDMMLVESIMQKIGSSDAA